MQTKNRYLIRAAEIQKEDEILFQHPLNPNSGVGFRHIGGKTLSELVGLKRTGVHLCRILPGKESFAYHRHFGEEEWVYILSGRGIAEIDDEELPVGPGDFLGYPPGTAAHLLKNPYDEDLVCLMGGERLAIEVGEFPRLGKRLVRAGGEHSLVDVAAMTTIFKEEG